MTPCSEIEPLLLPYELGAATLPERDACDAHVSGCPGCLTKYLALKRLREDAAAFDERPLPSTRARLRARVARRAPRRPVVWAFAAAALVALVLALQLLRPAPPASPPAMLIDSAPLPEDVL